MTNQQETTTQDKYTRAQTLVLEAAKRSKGWPEHGAPGAPDRIERHLLATARRQPHLQLALARLGVRSFISTLQA